MNEEPARGRIHLFDSRDNLARPEPDDGTQVKAVRTRGIPFERCNREAACHQRLMPSDERLTRQAVRLD